MMSDQELDQIVEMGRLLYRFCDRNQDRMLMLLNEMVSLNRAGKNPVLAIEKYL